MSTRTSNSATILGLIALLCTFVVGCEAIGTSGEDLPQNLQSGRYTFAAYDSTETTIVEGTLNFRSPQNSEWDFEGTWEFEEVGEISSYLEARMTGRGRLRGTAQEDGSVRISLHPEIEDADSVLRGSLGDNGRLEGEWAITDLGMDSASGRFEARP